MQSDLEDLFGILRSKSSSCQTLRCGHKNTSRDIPRLRLPFFTNQATDLGVLGVMGMEGYKPGEWPMERLMMQNVQITNKNLELKIIYFKKGIILKIYKKTCNLIIFLSKNSFNNSFIHFFIFYLKVFLNK